jgi:SAM-dependent methyltransferase
VETVTGLPPTRWAKDDEYNIPFYEEVAQELADVHVLTGQRQHDPLEIWGHPNAGLYKDGLYWSRRWEYPWAIENAKLVGPDGYIVKGIKRLKVLDVGCGRAPLLVYLGMLGCKAYGSDPGGGGEIDGFWGDFDKSFGKPYIKELRQESMSKLSWPDNYFDRVFCLSVIEHVPEKEAKAGVIQMKRVLKPGGLLLITVDNGVHNELIREFVSMPFYGEVNLHVPKPSRYLYFILGMVFKKET